MTKPKMKKHPDGSLTNVGCTKMDDQSYAHSKAANYHGCAAVCKVDGQSYFTVEDMAQGERWWPVSQEFYNAFVKEFQPEEMGQ